MTFVANALPRVIHMIHKTDELLFCFPFHFHSISSKCYRIYLSLNASFLTFAIHHMRISYSIRNDTITATLTHKHLKFAVKLNSKSLLFIAFCLSFSSDQFVSNFYREKEFLCIFDYIRFVAVLFILLSFSAQRCSLFLFGAGSVNQWFCHFPRNCYRN